MELIEKIAEMINTDWGVSQTSWDKKLPKERDVWIKTASQIYQEFMAHFASLTPEEVKLGEKDIDKIWNSPTNKTMQIEVPYEQFGKLIKQVKNISAQIAQAQLAKASAHYETKIEQARKEERERILNILRSHLKKSDDMSNRTFELDFRDWQALKETN